MRYGGVFCAPTGAVQEHLRRAALPDAFETKFNREHVCLCGMASYFHPMDHYASMHRPHSCCFVSPRQKCEWRNIETSFVTRNAHNNQEYWGTESVRSFTPPITRSVRSPPRVPVFPSPVLPRLIAFFCFVFSTWVTKQSHVHGNARRAEARGDHDD